MEENFGIRPSSEWLQGSVTVELIRGIRAFLSRQGTFAFPRLSTGLFSAAAGEGADFELSGYRSVWVRDNVQVAWAHLAAGLGPEIPVTCVQAIAQFYHRHRHRFVEIIEGRADFREPMNRPHIRFNGVDLSELPEKWAHAQNDALGYFLWLTCRLVGTGAIWVEQTDWDVLSLLLRYWETIGVWQDEDSGHWEEVRKVSASSLGCVLAGLQELRSLLERHEIAAALARCEYGVNAADVEALMSRCHAALQEILPAECIQADPGKSRRYDAALLFLIYPLSVVGERTLEERILADVNAELRGDHGIRRYPGDSYWCADYRELLSAEQRTADFSDSLGQRDQLLRPGYEAQWCIFDPIVSCIHGWRYLASGADAELSAQIASLQRSLSQLTRPGGRFPAWRCPESFFCERGEWVPNDITPLLWTQGNLLQALACMEASLQRREGQ
ncbi:MAG: glycoside hydrolase family 15 protein [Planctomycetota bacterium]